MGYAKGLVDRGLRILDYSGDFRFETPPSTSGTRRPTRTSKASPTLLPSCSTARSTASRSCTARIREASVVGNPGCFAVAMILSLLPAIRADRPPLDRLGRQDGHLRGRQEADRDQPFPGAQRERDAVPRRLAPARLRDRGRAGGGAGEKVGIAFVPHLVPLTRRHHRDLVRHFARAASAAELQAVYEEAFADEPFVRVLPPGLTPA